MAVRDVIRYPDPRLKERCVPAADAAIDIIELGRDLLDTMRAFPGCVGIAAPQVGALVRMVAIHVDGHRKAMSDHGELLLVDPEIIDATGAIVMREGCLSIPDFTGNVRRAESVTVRARTPTGEPLEFTSDAYEARVVLHELDHLDGILFLDRVDSARDIFPRKRYQ